MHQDEHVEITDLVADAAARRSGPGRALVTATWSKCRGGGRRPSRPAEHCSSATQTSPRPGSSHPDPGAHRSRAADTSMITAYAFGAALERFGERRDQLRGVGLDPSTTSTAADQVRLGMAAMQMPALAAIAGMPTAVVPVAGVIRNSSTLLGQDGIAGLKTASTQAAGGCVLLAAWQQESGRKTLIVAAASGQPGTAGTILPTHCKPATASCSPWITPSPPARSPVRVLTPKALPQGPPRTP